MTLSQGVSCAECIFLNGSAKATASVGGTPASQRTGVYPQIRGLGILQNDVHWSKVYDSNWCGSSPREQAEPKPAAKT